MTSMRNNKLNLESLPDSVKEYINQLEHIRRDFVANVSHELRTPLTVIRGYVETLMTQDQYEVPAWQKIFRQMYQQSIRMENIINDLLFLSRLENDDQVTEEQAAVDVAAMLDTLLIDAKEISKEKNHSIRLEANPALQLFGFEEEIKSVFSNIIINAIKYTLPNGRITIQWYKNQDKAVFRVVDTGIGIAKEHISRVTERFYRVEKGRSRNSGGTGLGLAIVKHVLMRHQGELVVESQLGKGSTFCCVFPENLVAVIKSS